MAKETLQFCFEVTDWQVLCEPHRQDIDGLTECITGYINFCVDTIVPARTVSCYPNNNREAKETYRRKLEWKLHQNNTREVWSGMRTITSYRPNSSGGVDGSVERANELNQFFNRFDTGTFI